MHDWKAEMWVLLLTVAVIYFVALAAWGIFEACVQEAARRWHRRPSPIRGRKKPWYVTHVEKSEALRSES